MKSVGPTGELFFGPLAERKKVSHGRGAPRDDARKEVRAYAWFMRASATADQSVCSRLWRGVQGICWRSERSVMTQG